MNHDAHTIEALAEEIRKVYIDTANRIRRPIPGEAWKPYAQLPEDTKELDRAFIRWHLSRMDAEAERWQDRLEEIIRLAGLTPFDASGNESGDPLDYTSDQVRMAFASLLEAVDLLRQFSEWLHDDADPGPVLRTLLKRARWLLQELPPAERDSRGEISHEEAS